MGQKIESYSVKNLKSLSHKIENFGVKISKILHSKNRNFVSQKWRRAFSTRISKKNNISQKKLSNFVNRQITEHFQLLESFPVLSEISEKPHLSVSGSIGSKISEIQKLAKFKN